MLFLISGQIYGKKVLCFHIRTHMLSCGRKRAFAVIIANARFYFMLPQIRGNILLHISRITDGKSNKRQQPRKIFQFPLKQLVCNVLDILVRVGVFADLPLDIHHSGQ